MSDPQPQSPESLWPPPWARSVAFMVGIGLLTWEATVEHSQHIAVYGLGFMLTGLPIARGLDRLLEFVSTGRGK